MRRTLRRTPRIAKDSPLGDAVPGRPYQQLRSQGIRRSVAALGSTKDGDAIEKKLGGEYWYRDYTTRDGVSDIQVFRNFETAIRRAGFTIDWSEAPNAMTAHKGDTWYVFENHGAYYYQTILAIRAMKQEVTADASQLNDQITKSGRVAVYGINFETNKAAILPESEAPLADVQKVSNRTKR